MVGFSTTRKREKGSWILAIYRVTANPLVMALFLVLATSSIIWTFMRPSDDARAKFDPCTTGIARGVPTFKARDDLGTILEAEGLHIGAELGVQRALFSKSLLSAWTSNREYHLVDVWAKQDNYDDVANQEQSVQDKIYATAMENVKPWEGKIHVCRNFTTNCVQNYQDDYFDFVYVDARHDFKGVLQDMQLWWPKLKQVGVNVADVCGFGSIPRITTQPNPNIYRLFSEYQGGDLCWT